MTLQRIFILILALSLILLSSDSVHAANLQDNLHSYQNQMNNLKQQASLQNQQKNQAAQQVQSLQTSINLVQKAVEQDNSLIQQHQESLSQIKNQEETLTRKRQQDIQTLGNYLCAEYEENGTAYLDQISWVLGAKTLDDLLSRMTYIGSLVDSYKKLGDQINADYKELQNNQQSEQTAETQLTQAVQSKQQMENSLNLALGKKKDLIAALTKTEQQTIIKQNQVQNDIDETKRLIEAQEREAELASQAKAKQEQAEQEKADQTSGKLTAPVKLNGTVGELLSFAESFLGSPYVWGGTTPNPGFDCSGLVQYVYAHFGIKLNRVTWDQYQEGQPVSANNLLPGDLVFFSTYAPGASHVGIYVGNRIMIDDSDYGVAYDNIDHPYWATRYLGARRVIAQ
ncbi:NlpC/P60 family protein [Desulfosporosinus sp. PR]|uniref:C40 family peptidase n=1 Tax=Candidatus Desulfosporosinus nitrosoreducens TaxID=3401928 RepID=UPI0027FA526C|nr:NlpC/P60 family protein [Desulfosporosinus sp. PR]MDQ7095658.1 NlpC/P60 family protein [Desulfosporosinus sp. PR]